MFNRVANLSKLAETLGREHQIVQGVTRSNVRGELRQLSIGSRAARDQQIVMVTASSR